MYTADVIKLMMHDPRPFWAGGLVKAFDCSGEFGNPSSHCSNTLGLFLLAWLDWRDFQK